MKPLVSVIIPTYRRSELIERAIESVLKQSYKPLEIIVVDDNNYDDDFRENTRKRLDPFVSQYNVIYVEHQFNKGLSGARNTGIELAKGEYIAFLDDDDEFLEDKISFQVDCFQRSSNEVGMVYGAYNRVDLIRNKKTIVHPKYSGNLSNILGLNHIGPPSMIMCKASIFPETGLFDERFKSREDIEFYFRVAQCFEIRGIEKSLINYYVHENAMSRKFDDKLYFMNLFISKHHRRLQENKKRWSEIQERLGELYALNDRRYLSLKSLSIAFLSNPKRLAILVKMALVFLGKDIYVKIRRL